MFYQNTGQNDPCFVVFTLESDLLVTEKAAARGLFSLDRTPAEVLGLHCWTEGGVAENIHSFADHDEVNSFIESIKHRFE
jgi:hypothetical protein